MKTSLLVFLALTLSVGIFSLRANAQARLIKDDENVIFFNTYAAPNSQLSSWTAKIHGWIFEPEENSLSRRLFLNSLCESLKLLSEDCQSSLFKERASYFLADNERGKQVAFSIGAVQGKGADSGRNGHFQAELPLSSDLVKGADNTTAKWLSVQARSGSRVFSGQVAVLERTGISVISDIDDTIKVSNVLDREELLLNTFVRPYMPTAGMAKFYRELDNRGVRFHYLSASPWQLYPAIDKFLREFNFPQGSFTLKEFRWKDSSFFDLLLSPEAYKIPLISQLVTELPERHYILIGDSGERDPEIYGEIVRRHRETKFRIIIRELKANPLSAERVTQAFKELAPESYRIIKEEEFASTGVQAELLNFALKLN